MFMPRCTMGFHHITTSLWIAVLVALTACGLAVDQNLSPQHPMLNLSNLETLEAFEAATGYMYTLPEDILKMGVRPAEADNRMRRFLTKWLSGEEVKVGIVGGSIGLGAGASSAGETDWFSILTSFFSKAFPQSKVRGRNGALSATGSSYMNLCLDNHVDADTDLLIVDYAINDFFSNKPIEHGPALIYEQLIRKALALPNSPSVLPAMFLKCFYRKNGELGVLGFHVTMEDDYSILASYYGLPYISVRNALWRKICLQQPGYEAATVYSDTYMHPNDYGQRLYSDLFVYLIQRELADLARDIHLGPLTPRGLKSPREALYASPSGSDSAAAGDQAVTALGQGAVPDVGGARAGGARLEQARLEAISAGLRIPPQMMKPMMHSNYEQRTLMCAVKEQLEEVVETAQGFKYGQDVSGAQLYSFHKFGWITSTAGSKLVLKLNTQAPPGLNLDTGASMSLYIGYLKSPHHMGTARLSCLSGCTCEVALLDGHNDEPLTHTYTTRLALTQHPQCRLQLEMLQESSSGQYGFKFTSIMVTQPSEKSLASFMDGFGRR